MAVACDGQPIDQTRLESVLSTPVESYSRLDLTTMPVRHLARSTVEQAMSIFGESTETRMKCADHLSEGRSEEAMSHLRAFCDIWQQVQDSIRASAAAMHLNLDEIQVEGDGFASILKDVKRLLNELKDAMENRDTVMVADILRYEFEEPTQRWNELLNQLHHQIDPETG